MQNLEFTVSEEFNGSRVDKAVSMLSNLSRVRIQELISQECLKVNNSVITNQNFKIKTEDHIVLSIPAAKQTTMQPKAISFEIAYEDDDLIVINKPASLTVHPGAGNQDHTLVNALIEHCGSNLSGVGGVLRPGIVHRLDKDTSGLMVVAKNDISHLSLSKQIGEKSAKRVYTAIIWGVPIKTNGIIENFIGRSSSNRTHMRVLKTGKFASTNYSVIRVLGKNIASIVECQLNTGRTHQIRVHMSHLGHSIIGDQTYGKNTRKICSLSEHQQIYVSNFKRQALHSCKLSFIHPVTSNLMEFEAELPTDMQTLIKALESE